ncbi:primosomal protein N' [Ornithinibacillus halotolerans]|uniref:Replication restart protein PriA n=1 Tax=Ornithinibacillus halotolerans TaxID=1274357 RepID=A0A916WBW7_9BACI|nr:primosomal protein N' [Ornithinibacillus halotolerans]GGA84179.1 primosomal protein N' [Ornithinibacillus halotolerans]
MNIASVIVDVQAKSINQTFDYLIPERYVDILTTGMRVIVPFGPRKITGFVVGLKDNSEFDKLKEIIEVLDIEPVLTEELLELGKWVADDTLTMYITAYQAMLPQVLKAQYKKELVRNTDERLPEDLEFLFAGRDYISFEEFEQSSIPYSKLQKAIQETAISINYLVKSKITKKYVTFVEPNKEIYLIEESLMDLPQNATKQRELLGYFIKHPNPIEQGKLLKLTNTTRSTIKTLIEKGLLREYKQEVYRNPYDENAFERTYPLTLTEQQERAILPIKEKIEKQEHDVFLVHGVTGSGKTEIYLQAIQEVLEKGKEAIVLVPEISLTPQMVKRFKGRFGDKVAVMHSALSNGEKYDEWRKIQSKEVSVVVGARSAIFAPFENIGIIIIDEEHETTYKQEDQPRYHARDVAIKRGQYHQCPVVLGSATPTLESFARAQKGVYTLATLDKRTNEKEMPEVSIVDMREELHSGNRSMFSQVLKESIEQTIARGEQIVLLLNRRGYSTFVMCRDCGHVKECPHCDIALTYHKRNNQLKCHYCSYEEPMPNVCPECSSDSIRYFGTGTQRVEESLSQLMPHVRVIRMDVDTTRKKGAHEKLLKQFANKEADILLGTQMIAKGLDFGNVTLVGVLTADSMLHLPDFRSSEKTFQLLTQVSGRAGRHELPGQVIIQTYTPEHYSIQLSSQYDYKQFFLQEMHIRRKFRYPPYVFLALITVSHPNHVRAIQFTQRIVHYLSKVVQEETTTVLGPTPSPVTRVKDRYRYQCMIKYKNEPDLRRNIKKIINLYEEEMRKENLLITVDMQPYHLM